MRGVLSLLLVLTICHACHAQRGDRWNRYIENHIILSRSSGDAMSDTVLLDCRLSHPDTLLLRIENLKNDTIYLFSTYFEYNINKSPYIYRYDKETNSLVLSFVPLTWHMKTYYDQISDRIRLDKSIFDVAQWKFFAIPPRHVLQFQTAVKDLRHVSQCYDYVDLKQEAVNFVTNGIYDEGFTETAVPPSRKAIVELAVYKDVDMLCMKRDIRDRASMSESRKRRGWRMAGTLIQSVKFETLRAVIAEPDDSNTDK